MHANEPEMAKDWEKKESVREKIRGIIKRELEATTTSVVPPHNTPDAFRKSTYKAIQVDDEDDGDELIGGMRDYRKKIAKLDKKESVDEAIKKVSDAEDGAGHRQDWIGVYKGKMIQFKANFPADAKKHTIDYFKVSKSSWGDVIVVSKKEYDSQQGWHKQYESVNESDLGLTYKRGKTVKVTHKKSGKELIIIDKPNVRKEYEKIGFFAEGEVNEDFWALPAGWSSQEARLHLDSDIKKMSKILGKASQQVIKIMMNGVKGDRYDALDIVRGIETGPWNRTHEGERPFMKMLWNKVRNGFRRYSKDRKLRK